jgi:hypothetical protein
VGALADLFDGLDPTTLAEAEDELRSAGTDPDKVAARTEQLAHAILGVQSAEAGQGRAVPSTARFPRRRRLLWATAAGLAAGAMAWALLRSVTWTPFLPDSATHSREPGPMLARRLPPPGNAVPGQGAVSAAQPDQTSRPQEQAAPQAAEPDLEDHATVDAGPNTGAVPVPRPVVDITSGTVVNAGNDTDYAGLMSPGVQWAVRHGLRMTVVDPRPVAHDVPTGDRPVQLGGPPAAGPALARGLRRRLTVSGHRSQRWRSRHQDHVELRVPAVCNR